MDKKLLDSLNNLSLALQDISDALNSKSESSSATGKAMQSGDFVGEIKEINIGVKALQEDSKQILANQQTIMNMSKSKSKTDEKGGKKENVAEGLGKDKTAQKNFKEGLGVILLIAVAVLAIGMAFNLVGKVNFLSVIALSIALPLLAIGFAKVHKVLKEVGFDPKKDAKNFIIAITAISLSITIASFILSMVVPLSFSKFFTVTFIALAFAMLAPSIMTFLMAFKDMSWGDLIKSVVGFVVILPAIALGIALASWAFQLVKPIGISQFLTAVGIGIVFAIISFGIRKLLKSFDKLSVADLAKAAIFLPMILPAIALGLALSSYAFQLIKPVGFMQLLTAVGIALVFAVISFGIRKILKSFDGLTPEDVLLAAIMLPLVLVALSYAIGYSSEAFAMIKPISFVQFLTALGIAAVFTVLSFGIGKIVGPIGRMKWSSVAKMPAFFVLISIAITLSSYILSAAKVIPAMTLLQLTLFAIALTVIVAAIGGVMFLLDKMKVSFKDAVVGGLLIVIIATAIMLSSHILALGNYKKYPDWKWALGVGLSIISFVPAIVLLGAIAMSGIGALAILAGAGMILVVAGTISAASHILSGGKYGNFPPLEWSASVALSMGAFTLGMTILGALIVGTFGLGGVMLSAGSDAVLMVADTIVKTAGILNKGDYSGGPTAAWAGGIAIALAAFSPIYAMLMANSILSLFGGGGVGPKDFTTAILTVTDGIVASADRFAGMNASFKNAPSKEWAEGVGLAIGAFSPVYGMLMNNSIMKLFGGGGVGPEEFSTAILTVSDGIIVAAGKFAGVETAFKNGPPKEWAEGVGLAIGAFAPVYQVLSENSGWMASGVSVEDMAKAIQTISQGIVDAAIFFAGNTAPFEEGKYPSKKWGEGVGAALGAFAPVFKSLNEDTGWFTSGDDVIKNMTNAVKQISIALVSAAVEFSKSGPDVWKSYPTAQWASGVKQAITSFIGVYKTLSKNKTKPGDLYLITRYATQMANTAAILGKNKKYFDMTIDPNFVKKMSKNILDYQSLVRSMSGFKSGSIGSMSKDPVQRVANGMVKIASAYDKLAKAVAAFSKSISSLDANKIKLFNSVQSSIISRIPGVYKKKPESIAESVINSSKNNFANLNTLSKGESSESSIKSKKSGVESYYRDAKGETQLQKLDKVIMLLRKINNEASTINTFLQNPKEVNNDLGSKGDG